MTGMCCSSAYPKAQPQPRGGGGNARPPCLLRKCTHPGRVHFLEKKPAYIQEADIDTSLSSNPLPSNAPKVENGSRRDVHLAKKNEWLSFLSDRASGYGVSLLSYTPVRLTAGHDLGCSVALQGLQGFKVSWFSFFGAFHPF